jgi:hypothetical protein
MADDTDRVGEVAPRHAAYWHRLAPPAYLGGPFADRSGGLITFEADTPARAEQLVTDAVPPRGHRQQLVAQAMAGRGSRPGNVTGR